MEQDSPLQGFHQTREKIISSIYTPLGFFVLALLIVEVFLIVAVIFSDLPLEIRINLILIGIGLFVFVVLVVLGLVVFLPQNLVFSETSHLQAMALYGEKNSPAASLSTNNLQLIPSPIADSNLDSAQLSLSHSIAEEGDQND